jgi:hypothetical protein
MGSNDNLKTYKRTVSKHEQVHDCYHDKKVKVIRRKERQKGKKIIKEALKNEDS